MKPLHKHTKKNSGFTLIEVTIAIIIVGVAVVSMMMLFAAGTQVNAAGSDLSSGVYLADQIRSLTDQTPYDNLLLLNGTNYNGVDADGNPVEGFNKFQQQVTVQEVDPVTMTAQAGSDAALLTVTIVNTSTNQQITQVSWLRVR